MLGTDLVPVLEGEGHKVTATDVDELDITVPDQIKDAVREVSPDIVIDCAAYTQVDKAEEEPQQAFLLNGKGTENTVSVCREFGVDLCYISTDYVFNGEKKGPYTPEDNPDPLNVYGASKLAGEKAIRNVWERFFIIRTSWMYGRNGKNFVHTVLDLAKNQTEIKVVVDQIGSPTWTVNLARALSKIIGTGKYGIYHVTDETEGGVSWFRFAQELVRLAHLDCRIIPVKSEDFPRPARRPKNSVLDLKAVEALLDNSLPHWINSLEKYLLSL